MKKLLSFIFIGLFLISFVSAFEFDNRDFYNQETDTYTIKDSLFGIPTTKVSEINRIDEERIGATELRLKFNYTLYEDNYKNPFRSIRLNQLVGKTWITGDEISFELLVKQGTKIIEKDIFIESCIQDEKNISNQICTIEKSGTENIEADNYIPLDQTKLQAGNYEILIVIKKGLFDITDWVLTLNGRPLTQWDVFDNPLAFYWTFESGNKTIAFNVNNNSQSNGTLLDVDGDFGLPIKSLSNGFLERGVNMSGKGIGGVDGNSINTTYNASTLTEFTWSMWLNVSNTVVEQKIMGHPDSGGGTRFLEVQSGNFEFNTDGVILTASAPSTNVWHQIVVTGKVSDNLRIYIDNDNTVNTTFSNGFFRNMSSIFNVGGFGDTVSQMFNGTIDEFGYWEVALTPNDVDELWNGGVGLTFTNPQFPLTGELNVTVDLTNPNSGLSTRNISLNFLANHSSFSGNLTNTTLIVWNPDNSVFGRNFTVITNTLNQTNLILDGFILNNGYQWNYFTCVENATDTKCDTSSSNNTFNIIGFNQISTTFNGSTNETSRQNFQINISTIPSILSVTAKLFYNSTSFNSDVSCDSISTSCLISNNIDIPLTDNDVESQNKTFFWEITTFDGTSSVVENSTTQGQNVSRINLEQCGGAFTDISLNFTVSDERNFTRINPFSFDATFDFWLGGGDVKRTNSFSDTSTNEVNICNVPTGEMLIDAIIEYSTNTTYTPRNYYFQNNTINTINQNISLYLLESGSATTFILKVQDQNLLPVPNVLITVERYDPGNNVFNIVQIARTDDNGATVGFFETEVVDYRFIISKNNQTLLKTTQQKIVGEAVPFTLIFTLGQPSDTPWSNFGDIANLTTTLIFNSTSEIVTFTYEDLSSIFEQGRLLVSLNNPSNTTNSVICNVTSIQSSAQLTCDVSSGLNASYISRGFITRDGNESEVRVLVFLINVFAAIVGNLGLLLGMFLMLVASFTFKFNEIAGIWVVVITEFFVNMFGLISFGALAITGLFVIAIIITFQFGK